MSDQNDANHLIQQGIAAYKAHNQQQAIALFRQATERDPNNQLGWLWLAGCSPSTTDQHQYLTRVLHINPHSEAGQRAATGLAQLDSAEATKPPPPADAKAPFVLRLVNLPFAEGRANRPALNSAEGMFDAIALAWTMPLLFTGIGIIIVAALAESHQIISLLFGVGLIIYSFFSLFRVAANIWRKRRLFQHGKILRGAITSCSGIWSDEDGYVVDVDYCFGGSSTGVREQISTAREMRPDLHGKPLPEPGTPVLVVYHNEKYHSLL